MTPYQCYMTYLALKNHFTIDSYDYFQYNGKVTTSFEKFESRSDQVFFENLSRKQAAKYILVAHLSENPEAWIGDIVSNLDVYYDWKKTITELSYVFETELKTLKKSDFIFTDEYPEVFNMLLRKELHKETFIILNECMKFVPNWNKVLQNDIVWPEYIFRLKKYSQFLDLDINKYSKMIKTHFANIQ